jgi:putative MATE family efflux protein
MTANNLQAATRLGQQPIGKLMLEFSLPAVTANVVTALYNIIDRIAVGRGIGEAALGGLSLVMPVMMVMGAFSILFGSGAANLISLRLGEGRRGDASAAANHCFWLLVIVGLVITAAGLIFLEPILSVLGAQDSSESLGYARVFMRIIFIGSVFQMISLGLSNTIRAQGFPVIAMAGMLICVGLNAGLVILFIFVFNWGVAGSAWATVIAQAVISVWFVGLMFSNKMPLRFTPFRFHLSLRPVADVCTFGSAQAANNVALSVMIWLMNVRISYYGVRELSSEHGGDIALSGMTIVSSVSMIIMMIVFGFSMGAQPILGYNYGAGKFKRVMETFKIAAILATIVAAVGFLLMHLMTKELILLFAPDGSEALVSFSIKVMKYSTIGVPFIGLQIISSGMFVAIGKPVTSLILSMSRQVFLLIPLIFLFGEIWGLMGVVMASPVSDIAATGITAVFIGREVRKLRTLSQDIEGDRL